MRVTRKPHQTQRVNRFVQELFIAFNENGADFIYLKHKEAYQCVKIISYINVCIAGTKTLLPTEIYSMKLNELRTKEKRKI